MTPAKTHVPRDATKRPDPYSGVPADRTVLALLQVGTRRCRLAAAFVAVVVALASQTANQALAQAQRTVLYLDAPVVSGERASRAGEIADAYSAPDSPVSRETLAWLEVPLRPVYVAATPEDAEAAFDSVTAQDTEGTGAITAEAALEAGQVMIAQLDTSPSAEDGDAELAAADAVRPRLSGGTRAPEGASEDSSAGEFVADPQWRPERGGSPRETEVPEYASSPDTAAPDTEPSLGSGLVVPPPSSGGEEPEPIPPTELAAAPSATGSMLDAGRGTQTEPYGPAGPISDTGQPAVHQPAPVATEDGDDAGEETYPDGGFPASEPSTEEVELAEAELPAAAPTAEPAPAPSPVGPAAGPASGRGGEVSVVLVSYPDAGQGFPPPAPAPTSAEDEGSEEIAYAEPPAAAQETPDDPSSGGIEAPAPTGHGSEIGERQSEVALDPQQAGVLVVDGETLPGEVSAGSPSAEPVAEEPPADQSDEVALSSEGSDPPEETPRPVVDAHRHEDPATTGGAGQDGAWSAHQQPEQRVEVDSGLTQRTEPRVPSGEGASEEPYDAEQIFFSHPSAEYAPAPANRTGPQKGTQRNDASHSLAGSNQGPEESDASSTLDHGYGNSQEWGWQEDGLANREAGQVEIARENAGSEAAAPRPDEEPARAPVAIEEGAPAARSREDRRASEGPVSAWSAPQASAAQRGSADPATCQTDEPALAEQADPYRMAEHQAERQAGGAWIREPASAYQEPAPQAVEQRTCAQPAPPDPQRVEPVCQDPGLQVAPRRVASASGAPTAQLAPAPEVHEPTQDPVSADVLAPAQQVRQDAGVLQAAQPGETTETPAAGR